MDIFDRDVIKQNPMKFHSLNNTLIIGREAIKRFPIAFAFAFIGTILAIFAVEIETKNHHVLNSILVCALGLTTFITVALYNERHDSKLILSNSVGFLFLGLMYLSLPTGEGIGNSNESYIRYGIFNVIVHLAVSVTPYLRSSSLNGFWNYNKTLFIRLMTTSLYSAVIFIGIVMAIMALKALFDFDIKDIRFMQLFILVVGVFNTWFFLVGIPLDYKGLDDLKIHPKGVRIFSQFILLPLLAVYLVILYAYGAKIIISADWPRGIVAYMISIVSILGILTLLLIYPYANDTKTNWITWFSKTFYIILLPLLGLLFVAISMRVSDYGITINRYLIITLGIWLTGVCTYFLFLGKNIKFVPLSLGCILLVMSFGPWNVFSVSERSQVVRLENILIANGLIIDGKLEREMDWTDAIGDGYDQNTIYPNDALVTDSVKNQIKSILDYLDDFHSLGAIESWYSFDVVGEIELYEENNYVNSAQVFMHLMGLKYSYYYSNGRVMHYSIRSEKPVFLNVTNVNFIASFNLDLNSSGSASDSGVIDGKSFILNHRNEEQGLIQLDYDGYSEFVNLISWTKEIRGSNSQTYLTVPLENTIIPFGKSGVCLQLDYVYYSNEKEPKLKEVSGNIYFLSN